MSKTTESKFDTYKDYPTALLRRRSFAMKESSFSELN